MFKKFQPLVPGTLIKIHEMNGPDIKVAITIVGGEDATASEILQNSLKPRNLEITKQQLSARMQ